ncbi:MAG TPA: hypothetical protein PKN66_06610 [Thermodesulfovibrio thiophilus]|nr:hypothetical protein [Thermodesulfovibrio thiophilus]
MKTEKIYENDNMIFCSGVTHKTVDRIREKHGVMYVQTRCGQIKHLLYLDIVL